jgi:hypothetical protein
MYFFFTCLMYVQSFMYVQALIAQNHKVPSHQQIISVPDDSFM